MADVELHSAKNGGVPERSYCGELIPSSGIEFLATIKCMEAVMISVKKVYSMLGNESLWEVAHD